MKSDADRAIELASMSPEQLIAEIHRLEDLTDSLRMRLVTATKALEHVTGCDDMSVEHDEQVVIDALMELGQTDPRDPRPAPETPKAG